MERAASSQTIATRIPLAPSSDGVWRRERSLTGEGQSLAALIARAIEGDVLMGVVPAGTRVPSSTVLAHRWDVSPSTAASATQQLARRGLLERRRGLELFVVVGARDHLLHGRRQEFARRYVDPLLAEGHRLGYDVEKVLQLVASRSD